MAFEHKSMWPAELTAVDPAFGHTTPAASTIGPGDFSMRRIHPTDVLQYFTALDHF